MARGASVDLDHRRAGRTDTLAVIGRGLIAFDDVERKVAAQVVDGALEQRGLAGAGRADEIERQDFAPGEPGAVARRKGVVLGQHAGFELDHRVWMMVVIGAVMVGVVVMMMMGGVMAMGVP